eukprot:SAG31_NODE_407_length_16049_cov_46.312915_8_plen_211_part_00
MITVRVGTDRVSVYTILSSSGVLGGFTTNFSPPAPGLKIRDETLLYETSPHLWQPHQGQHGRSVRGLLADEARRVERVERGVSYPMSSAISSTKFVGKAEAGSTSRLPQCHVSATPSVTHRTGAISIVMEDREWWRLQLLRADEEIPCLGRSLYCAITRGARSSMTRSRSTMAEYSCDDDLSAREVTRGRIRTIPSCDTDKIYGRTKSAK